MMITPYIFIDISCIFLLTILFIGIHTTGNDDRSEMIYRRAVVSAIVLIVVDIFWSIGKDGSFGHNGMVLINIMYCAMEMLVFICWMDYSNSVLGYRYHSGKGGIWIPVMLILVSASFGVLSHWSGLFFGVDDSGVLSEGPLGFVYGLYAVSPVLAICILMLRDAIRADNRSERRRCLTLTMFIIPILLIGIFQSIWYDVPFLTMAITLDLLVIFLMLQDQRITTDPLTGLNNRPHLEEYMTKTFEKHRSNGDDGMYILIMDMDRFKYIVDTFGHSTGSECIVKAADAIRRACGNESCFIASYGGDEYIIVMESDDRGKVDVLCDRIRSEITELNRGQPFEIHLSIGVSALSDGYDSVRSMFEAADQDMFEAKNRFYEETGYRRRK